MLVNRDRGEPVPARPPSAPCLSPLCSGDAGRDAAPVQRHSELSLHLHPLLGPLRGGETHLAAPPHLYLCWASRERCKAQVGRGHTCIDVPLHWVMLLLAHGGHLVNLAQESPPDSVEFPTRSCDNSSRYGAPRHSGGHQRSRLFAKGQPSLRWKML